MYISDGDLVNYYLNCIVTHKGDPCKVINVANGRFTLLPMLGGEAKEVLFEDVDTKIPPLGWIKSGQDWVYLYRVPQRRARKGYCQELLGAYHIGGNPTRVTYDRPAILRQLWKKPRKHPEVLSLGDKAYYGTDLVLDNGIDVVGKEKLAGYVRSLICNL